MADTETQYEYGYRIGTQEHWGIDHGTDGYWIPAHDNLPYVDLDGTNPEENIRAMLNNAGVEGAILRQPIYITRGPIETLER